MFRANHKKTLALEILLALLLAACLASTRLFKRKPQINRDEVRPSGWDGGDTAGSPPRHFEMFLQVFNLAIIRGTCLAVQCPNTTGPTVSGSK